MPPQTNATVTAVGNAPVAEDWDRAGAAGASKFAGAIRGYYSERLTRIPRGDTVDVITRRTLILDVADVDTLDLDVDDVITIALDDAPGPFTVTANTIARARLAGIPRRLQTSRIVLEDA